ncbi:MAG: response regulator [Candidatus Omnitrophota bacterium]
MIKNILLAEDDLGTSVLVKKQLKSFGYNVETAVNGREALRIIGATNIDLLITDVVMPEMDGVDLYMAIKNNPQTSWIPIIIITDKEMFKESFSALGVDHFVPKASNIDLLVKKIQEIETLSQKPQNYQKVLIGGIHTNTVQQMKTILQQNGCLVTTADNSMDLASKVFLMNPHIIFLDILMTEKATASELTTAFRALNLFKDAAIITYVHLSSNQINEDAFTLDLIKEEVDACKKAGITKYIGRFNRSTFEESLEELKVLHSNKLNYTTH